MSPAQNRKARVRVAKPAAVVLSLVLCANALAMLLAGPPPGTTDGPVGRLVEGSPEYASPLDARRAAVPRRYRVFFLYFIFNGITITLLGFALIARAMERRRRERLGLPEGLDEAAITSRVVGPGGMAPVVSRYRPSIN